jgi:hypothetical protein
MAAIEYEDARFGENVIRRRIAVAEGDVQAAMWLLETFAMAAERNIPVPALLGAYLASCVRRIVGGEDPASALKLKRAKHRPVLEADWPKKLGLALALQEAREQGLSYEEAIARVVASDCGASERTVERAYKKYRDALPEQR